MDNNDVVKRVRYALQIDDSEAARLVGMGGESATPADMAQFRSQGAESDPVICPDAIVAALLCGLVIDRRGPTPLGVSTTDDGAIDNNTVLKRVKNALELRSEDVRACIIAGGGEASASIVGAFLRRPGTRNFRGMGDQVLRRFLTGLARVRRPDEHSADQSETTTS